MLLDRSTLFSLALATAGTAGLFGGTAAAAQKLYKYQDANGAWVYTDKRPPSGQSYDEQELERTFERPQVQLFRRPAREDGGVTLIAKNTYFAPVQLKFKLVKMTNLGADSPNEGWRILPPRSETTRQRADCST